MTLAFVFSRVGHGQIISLFRITFPSEKLGEFFLFAQRCVRWLLCLSAADTRLHVATYKVGVLRCEFSKERIERERTSVQPKARRSVTTQHYKLCTVPPDLIAGELRQLCRVIKIVLCPGFGNGVLLANRNGLFFSFLNLRVFGFSNIARGSCRILRRLKFSL